MYVDVYVYMCIYIIICRVYLSEFKYIHFVGDVCSFWEVWIVLSEFQWFYLQMCYCIYVMFIQTMTSSSGFRPIVPN